jgi:hypothetical protein
MGLVRINCLDYSLYLFRRNSFEDESASWRFLLARYLSRLGTDGEWLSHCGSCLNLIIHGRLLTH